MNIGALFHFGKGSDADAEFDRLRALELQSCQVGVFDAAAYTAENAGKLKGAARRTGVAISALWAGWSPPAVWDFYAGPLTLGLVPAAYRGLRLRELLAASDFAEALGVSDVITHVGFIPENPNDPEYAGVVAAVRHLANYMKKKGQYFLFETGQETPVTLLRVIGDIGTGNLGINFDTANLILYGKANSVDAARMLGKFVRNLHIKDGLYPADGRSLGREVPLGQGEANIGEVLRVLYSLGYAGPLTIEREISGEEQARDIAAARDLLRELSARATAYA